MSLPNEFEYRLVGDSSTVTLEKQLNDLAAQGWRVVAMSTYGSIMRVIVERRIEPSQPAR